jgi:hypothetical protein
MAFILMILFIMKPQCLEMPFLGNNAFGSPGLISNFIFTFGRRGLDGDVTGKAFGNYFFKSSFSTSILMSTQSYRTRYTKEIAILTLVASEIILSSKFSFNHALLSLALFLLLNVNH